MMIEQPLRLADGTLIYVEVEADEVLVKDGKGGLEEVSSRGRDMLESGAKMVGEVAEVSFAKAAGMVKSLAHDLSAALNEAAADQAEVELALKIKGGGDIKLVKAMAEYDMKVKLTWNYPRPPAPGA